MSPLWASLEAEPAGEFPLVPAWPGTHTKMISLWSHVDWKCSSGICKNRVIIFHSKYNLKRWKGIRQDQKRHLLSMVNMPKKKVASLGEKDCHLTKRVVTPDEKVCQSRWKRCHDEKGQFSSPSVRYRVCCHHFLLISYTRQWLATCVPLPQLATAHTVAGPLPFMYQHSKSVFIRHHTKHINLW